MLPKKPAEFFEASIHLIYAVIAATGFLIATSIYIPVQNLFTYTGSLSAFALAFVYFFMISAWYGFFRSVQQFKHTERKLGISRYAIGLLNTFILYYMISLTSTKEGTDFHGIIWLLPVFFSLVVIAHIIKYFEYRHYRDDENENKRVNINLLRLTIVTTVIFLTLFIVQAFSYDYCIKNLPDLKWDAIIAWNPVFIVTSTIITGVYRWIMLKESFKYKRQGH